MLERLRKRHKSMSEQKKASNRAVCPEKLLVSCYSNHPAQTQLSSTYVTLEQTVRTYMEIQTDRAAML